MNGKPPLTCLQPADNRGNVRILLLCPPPLVLCFTRSFQHLQMTAYQIRLLPLAVAAPRFTRMTAQAVCIVVDATMAMLIAVVKLFDSAQPLGQLSLRLLQCLQPLQGCVVSPDGKSGSVSQGNRLISTTGSKAFVTGDEHPQLRAATIYVPSLLLILYFVRQVLLCHL